MCTYRGHKLVANDQAAMRVNADVLAAGCVPISILAKTPYGVLKLPMPFHLAPRETTAVTSIFAMMPKISIDYGINS